MPNEPVQCPIAGLATFANSLPILILRALPHQLPLGQSDEENGCP